MGTLAALVSCRDNGRGRADEGALCLSSLGFDDPLGHHVTPTELRCHEDKHKAPTHPHIHPLSLQDEATPFPYLVVKNHQDGDMRITGFDR